jgi:hypothetical protein
MSNEFYLLLIFYHLKLLTFNKFENPFLACLQFSLLLFTSNELLGNFPFVSHREIFPHVYRTVYCITTKFIWKISILLIYLISLKVSSSYVTFNRQLSQYSDSLLAARSGDRIPVGATFSAPIQTSPGAHPASYTTGTGSFLGIKQPGRGVDHPPPSSTEVKERVELYLYSPSGPSSPILGPSLIVMHLPMRVRAGTHTHTQTLPSPVHALRSWRWQWLQTLTFNSAT